MFCLITDTLPSSNTSTNISTDISNSSPAAEKPKDLKNNLPTPPRGLEARSVSSRLATLSWINPLNSNGEILTYTIFYQQEGSDRLISFYNIIYDNLLINVCKILNFLENV